MYEGLASVQDRLRSIKAKRIALSLPWDVKAFSTQLDFELLRRAAERRGLEIAIVSEDPDRRRLARSCGLSAFSNAARAQRAKKWRKFSPETVEPRGPEWWEEPSDPLAEPAPIDERSGLEPRLNVRLAAFAVAILAVGATGYAVVPSGVVTLVPNGSQFETIVSISVDAEADSVDHVARVVPARSLGVHVEDSAEIQTSGFMFVPSGWG
ncbi:MAG: hypothetical protein E3J64_04035, partial [Anaerolineales bacterium]